jgi:hypothetical protein
MEGIVRKKPLFNRAQSKEAAYKMIRQLKNNAHEISERSHGTDEVQDLCGQLIQLADSLLEWGTFAGRVEVWGAFTPNMLDYSNTEVKHHDE